MTAYIASGNITTATTTPLRQGTTSQELCRFKIANNSSSNVIINIVYDGVTILPGVALYAKGSNANVCSYDILVDTGKVLSVVTTTTDALTYYISGGAV